MTKRERQDDALEQMESIAAGHANDIELAHVSADKLMLKILRQEGYVCTAAIFESMTKWYA